MKLPATYIVLVDYGDKIGKAFAEVVPGDTFDNIVNDIWNGEHDHVLGVYRVSEGEPTINVTGDVADALFARAKKDGAPSRAARDLIDAYHFNWLEAAQ